MLTECPRAGRHPSPQPDGKHLNGTSTQQSSLVLSRFNLAGLGHFLGLFLQEKEQLSCWECWAVVIVHGWAVSGQCIHFILVHLPGDTLSPLVSSITCLLLPFKKKILLVFIFLLQCFCITNGTNLLHILAELTSVAGGSQRPARIQLSLCRLYFSNTSATLEIKRLLILWNNTWYCEHTEYIIAWY